MLPSPPAPSPSPVVADEPSPSIAVSPSPAVAPWKKANGTFVGTHNSSSSAGHSTSTKVLVVVGLGALALIVIGGLCLGIRRCTREDRAGKISRRHDGSTKYSESVPRQNNHVETGGKLFLGFS